MNFCRECYRRICHNLYMEPFSDYWKLLLALGVGIPSLFSGARYLISWLLRRRNAEIDAKVLDILRRDMGVFGRLESELSQETGIPQEKIHSSLLRLEDAKRVHAKGSKKGTRWYFVPVYSGDAWGFPRGARV
jgi:hypothetical protein